MVKYNVIQGVAVVHLGVTVATSVRKMCASPLIC